MDSLKAGNFFWFKVSILCCLGAMWTIQTLAMTQSLAQKGLPITGHVRLAEVNVYHKMFIFSYWWSPLTESTWPYPAPRLIINSTPAPESLAGCVQKLFHDILILLSKKILPESGHKFGLKTDPFRFCTVSPCNICNSCNIWEYLRIFGLKKNF